MLVSRVGKVLSFCLIILMGNAGASSSSSSAFEEETLRRGGNALRDYFVISETLAQELHCHIKGDEETDTLIKLMTELTSQKRSVDFLNTFKNSTEIYVNTPAMNPTLTCKGGSARTGYAPRPNIQMDFVYNSDDNAIGFCLSFYPINQLDCTTNDRILEGYIPFETGFVIKFSGQDPRAFNQFSGENKLLVSHVMGLSTEKNFTSSFYDDVASQKVRQFLWHTQNLEPFFRQTVQERCDNIQDNAYDAYLELFIELLGIDTDADREFLYPDAVDGTKLSSYKNYWSDRERAFKGLVSRAKQTPKIPGTERCYDILTRLLQFNPFNVRI